MSKIFPSWRYHREKGSKLVNSEEELAKLGAEWRESPADVGLVPTERFYAPHFEKVELPASADESPDAKAAPKKNAKKSGA